MFNILTDTLPTKFEGCFLNTDFKQALKFFRAYEDKSLTKREKSIILMEIIFIDDYPDTADLWDFIKYYLSGGIEEKEDTEDNNIEVERTFCFTQDSGLIYSAFKQVYNIDLTKELIHWWAFLELFKSLPDNTQFSKVIEIRTSEIPDGSDALTIAKITNLKDRFKLEPKNIEDEEIVDFNKIFLG